MKILASRKQYEGSAGAWLIVHSNDQFLLARRSETCQQDIGKWNWIGGGVDKGESPLQAAVREFSEEAGIDFSDRADEIRHLASIGNPISGGVCHYFILSVDSGDTNERLSLNNESNGSKWVTLGEILGVTPELNWPTTASIGPLVAYFGIMTI